MRILLIYPNARKEVLCLGDLGAIAEPLALEYIGTGAKRDGHEVKILDLRLHLKELDSQLVTYQPDVVGVTGYSMHVERALEVCKRAKELRPDCITVAGGHHATLLPEDFFEPYMDYVVVGEGVKPFRQMLAQIGMHGRAQDIPGVWSRVEGAFRFGGPQPPIDLEDLPMPDRTLVGKDRTSYHIDWMQPIALIRTSVGCPYRCSFCELWKIMDGRYHKRDVVRVVEELRTIPESYVFLVDDEPFVNPPRMKELAACIKDAGIQKEYYSYCRIDSFLRDRALMQTWYEIGLRRVFFGIETIFEHELKDYNKRQKLEQIIKALQTAREIGIHVHANFIINPNYTHADFEKVVDFIKRYNVEYPSFTILTPIPGTEWGKTFDHVLERQPNGRPNWAYFDLQHPVTETELPRDEFMQEYQKLYRLAMATRDATSLHPLALRLNKIRSDAEAAAFW